MLRAQYTFASRCLERLLRERGFEISDVTLRVESDLMEIKIRNSIGKSQRGITYADIPEGYKILFEVFNAIGNFTVRDGEIDSRIVHLKLHSNVL
jgi:hypothetical protein